ncbi:hypothetical protein LguiA_030732 [Lonicera macranthoides]
MRSSQFQPLCTNILVALLMVTIAVKTASAANSNTGNNTDYVALLAFKSNIMDDPYGVLNSWNDSSHFCEWQGVKCGNRHTRVTALDLTSSGLVGSLSPYIGNLTFLRVLSLENNTFQREISPEIGRLFRQRSIWLYNNSLEGEIPTNLSQLTSLVHLSIGNNKLVGKIPRELGDLSKLTFFSVLGNYLRGEIPNIQQDELLYLNLGQRIDIAIDVACALNYLHHHCGKPILHCDLKPSNILLDNDMVAHVGDFGLAKFPFLRLSNGNESTSIGIRGTVGYTAPEYGLGSEISMKGDVYSYGVLLLEMMTGRKPIDGMIYEGLNLRNIVTKALPDHLMEVVEPKLLLVEKEDGAKREFDNKQSTKKIKNGNQIHNCLIAMLRIGLACSMESPQDRMDINDVIHELFSDRGIVT